MMLHKTKGIVLRTTAYNESSIIVKAYTELFGLQSYIVNGVRKSKAKNKTSFFQPLTLLDMVVYHKEKPGLQRIAEIKPNFVLNNIHGNVMASGIALFINEMLYKTIKEEEPNSALFDFIWHGIEILEWQKPVDTYFHFRFLLQLTRYLGFYPSGKFTASTPYFNLLDGKFINHLPAHALAMNAKESELFYTLLQMPLGISVTLNSESSIKKTVLHAIVDYYKLHIENFGEIKSLAVLAAVWSD